jgi:hypothetical protein
VPSTRATVVLPEPPLGLTMAIVGNEAPFHLCPSVRAAIARHAAVYPVASR